MIEPPPEDLDKLRRRNINVVNGERVVTFRLIPLVTPEFVKDTSQQPNREVYSARHGLYSPSHGQQRDLGGAAFFHHLAQLELSWGLLL